MTDWQPRQCPHCRVVIPVDRGFYIDKKYNVYCGRCKKLVLGLETKAAQDGEE